MSEKSQHINVLIAIFGLVLIVVVVGAIGYLTLGTKEEVIQGEVEVSEYRVSSKVPGRILQIFVQEGDYVKAGDTLAIIDAPEVKAKYQQAKSVEGAASAMSEMAQKGARQEQIKGAYELWQQAKVAVDVKKKSYERVENLFKEGVVTAQKRDETKALYDASVAQEKAAKSQYDMAVNGARQEEKAAAAAKVNQAKGAVQEVNAYISETMQTAQMDGEVSSVYPKIGELVGTGSPIMTISMLQDIWGTFNVKEDQLKGLKIGDTFTAYCPAFDKDIKMKIYYLKDQGSYAAWKATKSTGKYDVKTFELRARPVDKIEGLRPGMSLIMKK